jgi:preprotein translocase subunit SecA
LGEINSLEEKFHSLKNYENHEKFQKFKDKIDSAKVLITTIQQK